MVKGKVKSSNENIAPPQPRLLRSRKRERTCDEISKTSQATLIYQDTEINNTTADATAFHHFLVQESTMTSTRHQGADQTCATKQDPATEEKDADSTKVSSENVSDNAIQAQETTVFNVNHDSQLEGFIVHVDDDANQNEKGKEETMEVKCKRSPSQTCTDQLQGLLPNSEVGNGSCATVLDEQLGTKENVQFNLERNHETSHKECSDVSVAESKEVTKEAEVLLPDRKKQRLGVCGLMLKERSHFLHVQKCENGQNRMEESERLLQKKIVSSPPSPVSLSIPAGSVKEQNKAEVQVQRSLSGRDDRAKAEVHFAVTASDWTSAVCGPSCSKGQSCEVEEAIVPCPEQTGDTKSDPPAEKDFLGNQEQQELERHTPERVAHKPQQQMKDGRDGSEAEDQSSAISCYSNPFPSKETENNDAVKAIPLQVNSVSRTSDEKNEEPTCDAGDSTLSTKTKSPRFSCGPVDLCEATVSPGGSERKDSCDPGDEPGASSSTWTTEQQQTRNTTDPFGSGCLDYVSDSQLNTISLTEEDVMDMEENLPSQDCRDATDLICGLIRELSSLNRKVMATHRELENLRRSCKSSRSSIR